MNHGYKNILGEERIQVPLFETGDPTFDTVLKDWFFGGNASGSALISGKGLLAAIVIAGMLAVASISGAGSQTAAGQKSAVAAATISGGGAQIAAGLKAAQASAGITAGGALSGIVSRASSGMASISSGGDLSGNAAKAANGAASVISADGAIIPSGEKSASGEAIVSGAGELTAALARDIGVMWVSAAAIAPSATALALAHGLSILAREMTMPITIIAVGTKASMTAVGRKPQIRAEAM